MKQTKRSTGNFDFVPINTWRILEGLKTGTSTVKYKKDKWNTVTTKWVKWDTYTYTGMTSRWWLLKWLIRGKYKLVWLVPANVKDKQLHLTGVKSET